MTFDTTLTADSTKAEIRSEWVRALRSNEYKQGRKRLRVDDKFCCLGVLCDLAAQAGLAKWESSDVYGETISTLVDGNNRRGLPWVLLPPDIAKWAGIEPDGKLRKPLIEDTGLFYDTLAGVNDGGHHDFSAIARLIEDDYVRTDDEQ